MNLGRFMPASLGAEPKKLAFLGVLVALLAVVYYMNSGPSVPPGARTSKSTGQTTLPKAGDPVANAAAPAPRPAARTGPRVASDEYVLTFKVPEGLDLSKVDPKLQTDKLERVRAVGAVGGRRSLFEFYTPPPPPSPKIIVPVSQTPPPPPPPAGNVKQPPPPPPPIPLQFYGYAGRPRDTQRKAFFIDGEEIFIRGENETIRDRYKIIRINVNSAEVEDTVGKNRQTLQILEPFEK